MLPTHRVFPEKVWSSDPPAFLRPRPVCEQVPGLIYLEHRPRSDSPSLLPPIMCKRLECKALKSNISVGSSFRHTYRLQTCPLSSLSEARGMIPLVLHASVGCQERMNSASCYPFTRESGTESFLLFALAQSLSRMVTRPGDDIPKSSQQVYATDLPSVGLDEWPKCSIFVERMRRSSGYFLIYQA